MANLTERLTEKLSKLREDQEKLIVQLHTIGGAILMTEALIKEESEGAQDESPAAAEAVKPGPKLVPKKEK